MKTYSYSRIPQFEFDNVLMDSGGQISESVIAKIKYRRLDSSIHPFDDVFNSIKVEHIRLFIPLINKFFGENYSLDDHIELLSPDGVVLTPREDGTVDIEGRTSDMLVRINGKTYVIECQSYKDNSMVIRMAEYVFLGALRNGRFEDDAYRIDLPKYTVVYVRSNSRTPKKTRIKVAFPSGRIVNYDSDNVLMSEITKEDIVAKKLYALIPFYILRYERIIRNGKADIESLEEDLKYFSE